MGAARGLIATRHDAVELAALHEDHPARQTAMPADPAPHRDRVDIPQGLRAHRAGDRTPVDIRHPGGMEAEARAGRRAHAFARDQPQHQRAGRQAVAVDDNALAGGAQHGEGLQVMTDLAAAVFGNTHRRRSGRHNGRHYRGTEQQAPNTHDPRPRYAPLLA